MVYIERTDFRMKDSKDYYGLAPGKSVLLRYPFTSLILCSWILIDVHVKYIATSKLAFFGRYAFPIKCTEVILGEDNESVLEVRAEYDPSKKIKPKVFLLTCKDVSFR